MLEYTDEHFRTLLRMLSRHAVLYTEMVVSMALEHSQGVALERWLDFGGRGPEPGVGGGVVLQLGGFEPESLAEAVRLAAPWHYDAINLNCGCPSDNIAGKGCFGARLMLEADRVARICAAMNGASGGVPITVKCRIGVVETADDLAQDGEEDDEAVYEALCRFVRTVSEEGGVRRFVVHARQAVLSGLSPRANRRVPPLRQDLVVRLAKDFPHLSVVLNGGVAGVAEAAALLSEHAGSVEGVMCGRAVKDDPWEFATVDSRLFAEASDPAPSRRHVLAEYVNYAQEAERRFEAGWPARLEAERLAGGQLRQRRKGGPDEAALARRTLKVRILDAARNLFVGEAGGKRFRAVIAHAEEAAPRDPDAFCVASVLAAAAACVPAEVLDAPPGVRIGPAVMSRAGPTDP